MKKDELKTAIYEGQRALGNKDYSQAVNIHRGRLKSFMTGDVENLYPNEIARIEGFYNEQQTTKKQTP